MPPKRKAATTKASETVANGAEIAEPTKAKRGRAIKQVEESEAAVEKTERPTRTAKAKAIPIVEISSGEGKAAAKTKTKAKSTKPKAEPKAKATKSKAEPKETAKMTKTKPTKNKPIAAESAPLAVKSKRGAKKSDDETENHEIPSSKVKTSKKKLLSTKATSDTEAKSKKGRSRKVSSSASESAQSDSEQNDDSRGWMQFAASKTNAHGDMADLRIMSWNVAGLRAWLKKDSLKYVDRMNPEIICLQEIKCDKDKIPDELNYYRNYKSYWCDSAKTGYAGVALLTAKNPIEVHFGVGVQEFDDDGRCITAEFEKFYLVNVYVPNSGRGLVTLSKRLEWNEIFNEYIAKLDEKKPVIVCGDMNVAHTEIDLTNPKTNQKTAGFTKEERAGFTEFLSDKYIDTFRSLYPEKKDAYTFWSYMKNAREKNIGWRLDYFVVSKRIMDNICDNFIHTNIPGSDHCPISLYLNLKDTGHKIALPD